MLKDKCKPLCFYPHGCRLIKTYGHTRHAVDTETKRNLTKKQKYEQNVCQIDITRTSVSAKCENYVFETGVVDRFGGGNYNEHITGSFDGDELGHL